MKFSRTVLAAVLTLAPVASLTTAPAFASEEHGVGTIVTDHMNLSYIDHVLTGRIANRPVFAKPLEDGFGIRLWHRAQGKDFETVFKKEEDSLTGAVRGIGTDGDAVNTQLVITALNPREGTLTGRLDGRRFQVFVTAPEREGHHFVSPTLEIVFDDGAGYEFTVENGKACMGCITKLSYATIAMLHTAGLL